MTKAIKNRIKDLENRHPEAPYIPIFQDWDDPSLWHPGGRQEGEGITRDEVETRYKGYTIFQVMYTDNWRE